MKKTAIIFNPHAGNKKLTEYIDVIQQILLSAYSSVTIYRTARTGDGAALVRKLISEVDVIIGAGGDGTIYELINELCKHDTRPVFSIIPGGTCNDFSRAIGMSQDPLEAAKQIADGREEIIDVGQTDQQYFLNFWGIGMITRVSENINPDTKDLLGRLSYYISTVQTINNKESFQLKVESEENSYEGEAVMMLVGNGPFTGGVRAFFPKISLQDGMLDVFILKEASLETFLTMLHSKVSKKAPECKDIIYFQAKSLSIDCIPEQSIDCDGEREYVTPSSVNIAPSYLTFIVGDFPE
ncbi:diacylglycerol/lipid kinase family protein [Pseudalkalibacillus caeni]|uniref:Diacylglycerol kinase family lipid kinase n=1 Tax=Exobacillus caeni TaxID=2574798 RepID=A0A5R9F6F0_9BACL|nr:diacylglycerol kinase family protein [Pseudalkalibacillus caeni]TLS38069.1 diacylglycerol kinase family lipid kinase [Pseudalkalibacillus caeni]